MALSTEITPSIDVFETKNEKVIYVDLPGVDKKDVKLTYEKGLLTLEGEKRAQLPDRPLVNERQYGKFRRNFKLTFPVKENKISARFLNGVLSITLPKAEVEKHKTIPVG